MAIWTMPYQKLQRSGNILIAARGSSIDTFDLNTGAFLSSWSTAPTPIASAPVLASLETPGISTPPAKRRKVSDEEDVADPTPAEEANAKPNVQARGNGNAKKQKKRPQTQTSRAENASSGLEHPAVICLAASEDGKHVVAVTAEDKSVRVLEHVKRENEKQELRQISIRYGSYLCQFYNTDRM